MFQKLLNLFRTVEPHFGAIEKTGLSIPNLVSGTVVAENIPETYLPFYDFPIQDQNHQEACVAFATARKIEMWEKIQGKPYRKVEESFIFKCAKHIDSLPASVQGTYDVEGMIAVGQFGYVYSDEYSNDPAGTSLAEFQAWDIPAAILEIASTRKINLGSVPTTDVNGMKLAIMTYGGLVFGTSVSQDWWFVNGQRDLQNVPHPIPSPVYPKQYGHDMFMFGWDKDNYQVIQSWGSTWSGNGKNTFSPKDYPLHNAAYYFTTSIKPNYNAAILSFGQTNADVLALQARLYILGFLQLKYVTGYYGPITAQAILQFQNKYVGSNQSIPLLQGKSWGPLSAQALQKLLSTISHTV